MTLVIEETRSVVVRNITKEEKNHLYKVDVRRTLYDFIRHPFWIFPRKTNFSNCEKTHGRQFLPNVVTVLSEESRKRRDQLNYRTVTSYT